MEATASQRTKFEVKPLTQEQKAELEALPARIERIPYFQPDGKPKREWKVFYADTWEDAWGAAKAYAEKNGIDLQDSKAWAGGMSSGAAYGTILFPIENSSWAAGFFAPWNRIYYAFGATEQAAHLAGLAGGTTAVLASLIVTRHLEFENRDKYRALIDASMEVWEKGYGLAGEADGVMYVFCKGKPPVEQIDLGAPRTVEIVRTDGSVTTVTDVKELRLLERK